MAWIGLDDARRPMLVQSWSRGADGRTSVSHIWAIGRTGGGKSTTIRVISAKDLHAGREVLIPVDGKGTMSADLLPFSLTGSIARGSDASQQAVALAYEIFLARQQRLSGDNPWTGPRQSDPIVTLFIDEYSTIGAYLTGDYAQMICEMGRMSRDLGVRVVQSGQNPLVDALIGGSEFRSQCRIVLGHGILDATHDRIATQSGGEDAPSLRGLPTGRAVVLVDGHVVARNAKIAFVTDTDLARGATPGRLHPDDLTDTVTDLLEVCQDWGTARPEAVVDVRSKIDQWRASRTRRALDESDLVCEPGTGGTDDVVVDLTDRIPTQPQGQARPAGSLRDWVLTQLLTRPGTRRAEIVGEAVALGWSRSGAYRAIDTLIAEDAVAEDAAGQLVPAAWSTR